MPRISRRWWRGSDEEDPRAALAKVIPRRPRVSWWLALALALGFAAVVTPAITAERWLLRIAPGTVVAGQPAPFTVRAPLHGYGQLRTGGGVVIARGEIASADEAALADAVAAAAPRGPGVYLAFFALTFALAVLFSHHVRRSTRGRLVRVQITSLAVIALLAVAVKIALLSTALSALIVPVAILALVPTMALDRVVGLATGVLAALVISLLVPFDVHLALLLLVQTVTAGLVVAEHPRRRWLAALTAGAVTTLCTTATCVMLMYLTSGHAPGTGDLPHAPWLAAAIGAVLAAVLATPLHPVYQLLVGEITQNTLIALEDLGHPVLRQIAEKAPGTWQHSLMMANMAEIAANAIGANGRLVRVGAYFHDLGKSLQPKYFIENLEAGETSPHDLLPPEVSCDAIFAHVTEGLAAARKAGLHERIIDFMHMHHGNGVLEYFWAKCREQGNPHQLTVEQFRYPGHPPQSRETALLAICDAVEAASRTLAKPEPAAIDSLVQRIVYGKLHLGQLDESGLSMSDLRRISDSLRETIRHANHTRIPYPWQQAGQDASASATALPYTSTSTAPRLDSLDRTPRRDSAQRTAAATTSERDAALAATADLKRPDAAHGDAASAPTEVQVRAGSARNAQPGAPRTVTPAIGTPRATPVPSEAVVYPPDEPVPVRLPLPRDAAATRPGMPPPPPDDERPAPAQMPRATGPVTIYPAGSAPPLGGDRPAPLPRTSRPAATHPSIALPPDDDHETPLPHTSRPAAPRPSIALPPDDDHETPLPHTSRPAATHPSIALPPDDDHETPLPRTSRPAATHPSIALPSDDDDDDDDDETPLPRTSRPAATRPSIALPSNDDEIPLPRTSRPAATRPGMAPPDDDHPAPTQPPRMATYPSMPPPPPDGSAPAQFPSAVRATAQAAGRTPAEFQTLRGPAEPAPAQRAVPRPVTDDEDSWITGALPAVLPEPPQEFESETEPAMRTITPRGERVTEPARPAITASRTTQSGWSVGLAERIDAALDAELRDGETQLDAELRALLGQRDAARDRPGEAGERPQHHALGTVPPRRAPHPTSEVDPDDIEAAIEVAPPARRPTPGRPLPGSKPGKPG